MVLCMRLETTSPTTSLRRPAACCTAAPGRDLVSGILLFLRSAGGCQFPFAGDGLDPRDVFAQAANLFQTLGLSHVELKLQLEQLVVELMLLVAKLFGRKIAY